MYKNVVDKIYLINQSEFDNYIPIRIIYQKVKREIVIALIKKQNIRSKYNIQIKFGFLKIK